MSKDKGRQVHAPITTERIFAAMREACANEIERISEETYAVVLCEHKEAADWLRNSELLMAGEMALTAPAKMTKIVWNGCDNYVEADQATQRGYDFDGEKLYHGAHEFVALYATEINSADLPKGENGKPDFNGVLSSESGKFYK